HVPDDGRLLADDRSAGPLFRRAVRQAVRGGQPDVVPDPQDDHKDHVPLLLDPALPDKVRAALGCEEELNRGDPDDLVPGAPGGSDVARRHGGLTRAIKGEIGEQMKTVADLPVVDIDDEAFWQDVYPALHEARSISPVGVTPGGLLYVLGFDEVDGVLKDKRFGAFDQLALMGVTSGRVWEWWQRVMFSNNDPVHGRLRKLVNRAFTPPQIERKREVMGRIAEG